jgi:hypothetical protein
MYRRASEASGHTCVILVCWRRPSSATWLPVIYGWQGHGQVPLQSEGFVMQQRLRVFELARELGVSILVIIQVAQRLKLPIRRGIAELTPRQEQLIRDEVDRGGWRDRRHRVEEEPKSYDVTPTVRYTICECCGFHFSYEGWGKPDWCDQCAEHYEVEGESTDRTIARLADHEPRLRKGYRYSSNKATEYEGKMKSAFESRQKWKAALVEVALGHEPADKGKCTCGASESPCATMRLLEYANKGIARQVERLTALSREELDHELYRDEPWRVDLKADDGPAASTGTSDQSVA